MIWEQKLSPPLWYLGTNIWWRHRFLHFWWMLTVWGIQMRFVSIRKCTNMRTWSGNLFELSGSDNGSDRGNKSREIFDITTMSAAPRLGRQVQKGNSCLHFLRQYAILFSGWKNKESLEGVIYASRLIQYLSLSVELGRSTRCLLWIKTSFLVTLTLTLIWFVSLFPHMNVATIV